MQYESFSDKEKNNAKEHSLKTNENLGKEKKLAKDIMLLKEYSLSMRLLTSFLFKGPRQFPQDAKDRILIAA